MMLNATPGHGFWSGRCPYGAIRWFSSMMQNATVEWPRGKSGDSGIGKNIFPHESGFAVMPGGWPEKLV
jgi:hypothetical protein